MIICRTPFRVSLFGGGTDFPAWYRQHGGAVLATSIDKYCYLTCRYLPPFFEHRFRMVYSKIENSHTIDEISHPAIREVLRFLNITRGVEIHHDGDLPARSGMGTSSSFTVGLLHALYALQGQMPGKHRLAQEAIHIEQDLIHETVGCQDQITAAHGGFNHIIFSQSGEISLRPITISRERIREFNEYFLLFYTGIMRTSSSVADSFVHNFEAKKRQLRIMKDLVDEGVSIVTTGKHLEVFGELMHEAWMAKRSLSALISNPQVDELYETARSAGALGGKLTGAGGGGFLLLFAPPLAHKNIRASLANLITVPFTFEKSGSQIIFFDQEEDYTETERQRVHQRVEAFREINLTATGTEGLQ
jgi:D-glycero-alpha-D-manno-heptose-7-phosphate kinase